MARGWRVAESRPGTEWTPGSAREGLCGSLVLSEADILGLQAELCLPV